MENKMSPKTAALIFVVAISFIVALTNVRTKTNTQTTRELLKLITKQTNTINMINDTIDKLNDSSGSGIRIMTELARRIEVLEQK